MKYPLLGGLRFSGVGAAALFSALVFGMSCAPAAAAIPDRPGTTRNEQPATPVGWDVRLDQNFDAHYDASGFDRRFDARPEGRSERGGLDRRFEGGFDRNYDWRLDRGPYRSDPRLDRGPYRS